MAFECKRHKETLDWFLYREEMYRTREDAVHAVKNGAVKVNGKYVKDTDYVPKKGDKFELIGYFNNKGSKWFTISVDLKD
jgi:ribosomal protein S4